MSIEVLTLLLIGCVMTFFLLGAPVGLALGGIAMGMGYMTWGEGIFNLVPTTIESNFFSFVLLAIPLYIYMGQLLTRSGIGDAMFNASQMVIGRIRGSLAVSVIGVCSMIGAMVGIIGAGIMTSGSIALKPMLERGYDKRLALGVIMAGGGLGILIPPSIPMVMYAATTQNSVGRMFLAAIIPALISILLLMAYVIISCKINPQKAPLHTGHESTMSGKEKLITARDGLFSLLLIVAVLGSIIAGIATPTESGAIGVVGAILLAFVFKRFRFEMFKSSGFETAMLVSVSMWIILGASLFSNFHMLSGVQTMVSELTEDLGLPPLGVIILMQVIMLLLGFIIDELIIVLMCAPLFTPIVVSLGYDPIWFGILMILNIEIAVQTPPYGFALFYLKGIAPPDVSMMDIYRSILPFIALKLCVLVFCMVFPEVVMWLPNMVMGEN
ncbi:TRAP transporter large permease [Vibrio furnissii]|uniref:TRAP transporter large permease protein n=1 Tax=Vibrio furnissii TaxID=29494 RepID=A0A0Q2QVJ5_VIBFU|nr:TRAP transporter large permease subunit [Vibrio furnissii]KQH84069.1 C4-dicarboxylate ABC transporter permease [Vibrio furnissii]MCG6216585.1 TRAP transporter large permease subunit [Vibrio furnissii]WJG28998.1 TRAP transporter large permease subunit [Vibrio furnissii]